MDRLLLPRGLRLRRRHAAARPARKDDTERRVLINTIGPVWDGNEVWLLVAGGATFAAFPEWYATLFSGFYLPLLLILVALIVRGLAFEYRAKRDDDAWRRHWDLAIIVGSFVPALLWGVAFANIVRGVPIDADMEYAGSFFNLLNPYALLGGADHAAAVPHPRRDVRRAQDRRRDPAPTPAAWPSGSASCAAVVAVAFLRLDPGRDRHGGLGGRLRRWPPSRCSAGLARSGRAARAGRFLGTFVAIALGVAGLFLGAVPGRDAVHRWPTASRLTTDQRRRADARTR